jgi:hypothetical protein
VPAPLADLVTRMLAKSRDERPATPADVVRQLQPYCAGADLTALLAPAAVNAGST